MTQQTKGESATILGVITGIIQPREGAIPTTPGKILIKSETSGDDCTVSVWQLFKDNERTTEMPDLWNTKIHPEWSIGKRVMIGCQYKDAFVKDSGEVIHQYTKMVSIEYLGGGTPPQAETAQVAQAVAPTTAPSATPAVAPITGPPVITEEYIRLRLSQMTQQEKGIAWAGAHNNAQGILAADPNFPMQAGADVVSVIRDTALDWFVSRAVPPTEAEIDATIAHLNLPLLTGSIEDEPSNEEVLFEEAPDLGKGVTEEI